MNIYCTIGSKVKYIAKHGYVTDLKHANSFLEKDGIYTVLKTEVDGFSTKVILSEFPKQIFNSCHFINI